MFVWPWVPGTLWQRTTRTRPGREVGILSIMNANEWLAAYAEKLGGAPPTVEEFRVILELAGVAAHASERVAAPAACWVAATAGVPLDEALRVANEVSA
jgi:hypothetical protein